MAFGLRPSGQTDEVEDEPGGSVLRGKRMVSSAVDGMDATGDTESGGGLRRRRRAALALVASAVLLGVGGVGGAMLVKSPQQLAADAAKPPPSVLTAQVEQRVLTSNVVTRGKVTAGQTVSIVPQAAGGEGGGTPVVTKIPVRAGQSLSAGQLILEVSGRPVFILPGSLPGYRDLKPGARGDDVTQLQAALLSLGHAKGATTMASSARGRSGRSRTSTRAAATSRCPRSTTRASRSRPRGRR